MVIELKWDQSADTAIRQIREKRYAGSLTGYSGEILLVGISYDKDIYAVKVHLRCAIDSICTSATCRYLFYNLSGIKYA